MGPAPRSPWLSPWPPSAPNSSGRYSAASPTWRRSPAPPASATAGAAWPPTPPSSAASAPSAGPRTDRGRETFPLYCSDICFIKAPSRNNPELASAAADGDFYFMHHPEVDDDEEWRLRGCNGGFLLFSLGRYSTDLAVYDPLDRTAVFFKPPHDFRPFRYAIVADEADASFQVITIQPDPWGNEASVVFSSRTRSWVKNGSLRYRFAWPYTDGIAAGRFAYWRSDGYYCGAKEEILVVVVVHNRAGPCRRILLRGAHGGARRAVLRVQQGAMRAALGP
ncbi:uncharacterized protein [Triticum aestivum]|uniref:uncharacterized protein n=1 Tax=Triticum aestivum TaxID=4565 RepID=UPI001D026563|nr:uncharacterized protein LOC123163150 [Triticum aestivum]